MTKSIVRNLGQLRGPSGLNPAPVPAEKALYGIILQTPFFKQNQDKLRLVAQFEIGKYIREEFQNWRSQFVTSKSDRMGLRYEPMVFTEQGVAMLSSVLNSKRAIQVNIQIVRTFSKLREMLSTHKDLKKKIEAMEKKYDENFRIVFEAIQQLLETDAKFRKKIGFTVKKKQAAYAAKTKMR
jgi:hypothetical protein